eukprot:4855299-Ditylum_brightwellii.AAC.1
MDDKYVILNHLGWFQCAGFGKFSFAEDQHIPHKLQPQWTEAVSRVAQGIADNLHQAHPYTHHHKRALDRRLKMWLILPFLLICKLPDKAKMIASLLDAILTQRMVHWTTDQWHKLIKDYEADVIGKEHISTSRQEGKGDRDLKSVSIEIEHLSKNRCSRAGKLLCSHGLSDIMDGDVLLRLEEKHPNHKAPIPDPTT